MRNFFGGDEFTAGWPESGKQGEPGKSAYEIAVEHGYIGTEAQWLASLKGEPGEDGADYVLTQEDKAEIAGIVAEDIDLNGKLDTDGDGKDVTVSFTQATTRTNLATGEKLSVLFGKIKKWFADLKTVAFTGSYNDLGDKPSIPSAVTESTVSEWGFTKNTGTYSKPSGGIPASDLASGVIPTVNDAVLTIKQGGAVKGTFSANAASATEINLDAGGGADNTFVVTGEYDGSLFTQMSATYAQILAAYNAGKVVELHLVTDEGGTEFVLPLKCVVDTSGEIYFGADNTYSYFDDHRFFEVICGDNNLWDFAGYDYAKKDEFVDEEQIIVPAYTNLVGTAGYTDGKLLNSNGAEGDSASQFVTGFIPVTSGDVIRFKPHDNIYADSCVIAFYDAQKTLTAGIGKTFSAIVGQATYGSPTIADNTFTIDTANVGYYFWQNIAYVRFCGNGGGAGAIVTIDEEISGTITETKYTLKEEIKVKEASLDFAVADVLKGRNIVCFGDSILALIRNETGVLAQAAKMTGGNFINCAFGGCRMSQHPESKYDAFSFYQIASAVAANDFSDQDTAAVATGVPDYYPEQIARLKAVDWDEVDEIIVAYGTNDYDANVVIDGSTNSTIIGALKNGLSAILTAYPHIKVNIASTIFRMWSNVGSDVHTNTNGDKLPDVNNALREVAAERKANYIDLYNTCGITTDNASTMLSDGTHPSAVGCKIIGRVYGGSIIKPTSAKTALKEDLDDYRTSAAQDVIDGGFVKLVGTAGQTIQTNVAVPLNVKNNIALQHRAYIGFQTHDDATIGYIGVDGGKPTFLASDGVTAKALQSEAITDTAGYFTTDTVDGALAEIGAELENKQNTPEQITAGANITLADNTEYRLTDVSTLTIAYPTGTFECWMRITTAASGTITITLPTSTYIGDAPTFGNGEVWELSIKDGVVVAGKVVSA